MLERSSADLITRSVAPVALVGLIMNSGCSDRSIEIQSRWTEGAVIVDGKVADWTEFPLEYSEEERISLGVRNDTENLYFLFLSRDERLVRKLQMAGITLWFDKASGKRKDFGIRYTGSVGLAESLVGDPGLLESMTPEQKAGLEQELLEMQSMITVIENGEEIPMQGDNPQGPAASSASQKGVFCYEFKIPIERNDSVTYAIGGPLGEKISMGVELGGISPEDREETMQQRSQMEGSRGSGMRSTGTKGGDTRGMRRRGPEGDGQRSEEQMLKKQEIWISIHLARNPDLETERN